jgi:hypothetical protein
MGMFTTAPPSLPQAPTEFSAGYMNQLLLILRGYFVSLQAVQHISAAQLNLNLDTLPTQAVLATLRAGDVYRDATAGNVLKVKV